MHKQLTDYDVKDIIKLAVGAAPGLSSPAPWKAPPQTGSAAANTGSSGGFGTELGKSLAPAGTAALNTGMNTIGGIGTTATGLANTAAGGIGSVAAGIGQGAARFQDAVGLTRDATSVADAFAKPMNQAFVAGLKDTAGGAADTLSGGYYNYDGTEFAGAQPTAPPPGTAVEQMRSGMRDQLGRGTASDIAFRYINAGADLTAETAAFGGVGRGLNVGAKAIQGARTAAPILNAAAKTPIVGKPLATAGNWMAGPAPAANMFAKTPVQYANAAGALGLVDEVANAQNHFANASDPNAAAPIDQSVDQPAAVPAPLANSVAQPALTSPEATQPNPQGGPSTAQKPPAPAPAPEPAPAQPAAAQSVATPVSTPVSTHVGTADKAFEPELVTQMQNAQTPEEKQVVQQKAVGKVQQVVASDPVGGQGVKDLQSGKTDTAEAKEVQGRIDTAERQRTAEELEKLKKAHPEADISDPKTYGIFLNQAAEQAKSLPFEHKLLMGLGLGGGLIGILSSLFGDTGMAGGLLGVLGLAVGGAAGAAGGVFGDQARAQTGQLMNDAASFFGGVNVPTADKLAPGAEQQTVQQIQNAMNQTGEKGQRGGWAAGQKIINEQRSQADTLLKMPRTLAITSLMGLRGEGAPKTEAEAATLLDSIAQRQATASQPSFLQQRAREQARATLREQDKGGWLPAMLKNRGPDGDGMNWMREGGVHSKLNTPEHKMFLNPDGTLPAGTTEDEFINNMLRNAYGEYPAPAPEPEKVSSMNIAQQIFFKQAALKAARCWAGYEPVPGKAPYSDNSCRPKRKKKVEKKAEQYSAQPFNPAIGYKHPNAKASLMDIYKYQMYRSGQEVAKKTKDPNSQYSNDYNIATRHYDGLIPRPPVDPVSPGQMAAPVTPAQPPVAPPAVKLPVNPGPRNTAPAFQQRMRPPVAPAAPAPVLSLPRPGRPTRIMPGVSPAK